MKKLFALSAMALCTTVAACADRRDDRPMPPRPEDHAAMKDRYVEEKAQFYFDKMDMNHDGSVSRAEARAFNDTMFRKADTDRNGRLSYDELLEAKRQEMMEFKDAKRNGDMDRPMTNTMERPAYHERTTTYTNDRM